MTTNEQNRPINNTTNEAVTTNDLGTASALVLSLAPYVSADDVGRTDIRRPRAGAHRPARKPCMFLYEPPVCQAAGR
jgi:hypothetical protein